MEAFEGLDDLLDLVGGGGGVVGEVVQGHEIPSHGVGVPLPAVDVLLAAVADADAAFLFLFGGVGAGEGVQGQVDFVGGAIVAVDLPAEPTVVPTVEAESTELHVAAGTGAGQPLGVGDGGGDETPMIEVPAARGVRRVPPDRQFGAREGGPGGGGGGGGRLPRQDTTQPRLRVGVPRLAPVQLLVEPPGGGGVVLLHRRRRDRQGRAPPAPDPLTALVVLRRRPLGRHPLLAALDGDGQGHGAVAVAADAPAPNTGRGRRTHPRRLGVRVVDVEGAPTAGVRALLPAGRERGGRVAVQDAVFAGLEGRIRRRRQRTGARGRPERRRTGP
mmetsp:Transcript_29598/g.58648  ORF Transcript_29598/g.58648 Transcript_29598/m.58648 type:complete len:330 (-) Transcript_29598:433-1422(-)